MREVHFGIWCGIGLRRGDRSAERFDVGEANSDQSGADPLRREATIGDPPTEGDRVDAKEGGSLGEGDEVRHGGSLSRVTLGAST